MKLLKQIETKRLVIVHEKIWQSWAKDFISIGLLTLLCYLNHIIFKSEFIYFTISILYVAYIASTIKRHREGVVTPQKAMKILIKEFKLENSGEYESYLKEDDDDNDKQTTTVGFNSESPKH